MPPRFAHAAPLVVIALSALGFYLLFHLNNLLFQWLDYSYGVSWLFLPSGLRLALVLVFGGQGAIGVILGSLCIALEVGKQPIEALLTALVSGLAPWMARWISLRYLDLRADLSNLRLPILLKTAVLFALVSAVSHQLLYVSLGLSEGFVSSTSVMVIGDLAGTLVMLYGVKLLLGLRPGRS